MFKAYPYLDFGSNSASPFVLLINQVANRLYFIMNKCYHGNMLTTPKLEGGGATFLLYSAYANHQMVFNFNAMDIERKFFAVAI